MNSVDEHLGPGMLELWKSRNLSPPQLADLEGHIKVCTECFADLFARQTHEEHEADVARARSETSSCPSISQINNYIANGHMRADQESIRVHIAGCEHCQGLEATQRFMMIPLSQRTATV